MKILVPTTVPLGAGALGDHEHVPYDPALPVPAEPDLPDGFAGAVGGDPLTPTQVEQAAAEGIATVAVPRPSDVTTGRRYIVTTEDGGRFGEGR